MRLMFKIRLSVSLFLKVAVYICKLETDDQTEMSALGIFTNQDGGHHGDVVEYKLDLRGLGVTNETRAPL